MFLSNPLGCIYYVYGSHLTGVCSALLHYFPHVLVTIYFFSSLHYTYRELHESSIISTWLMWEILSIWIFFSIKRPFYLFFTNATKCFFSIFSKSLENKNRFCAFKLFLNRLYRSFQTMAVILREPYSCFIWPMLQTASRGFLANLFCHRLQNHLQCILYQHYFKDYIYDLWKRRHNILLKASFHLILHCEPNLFESCQKQIKCSQCFIWCYY